MSNRVSKFLCYVLRHNPGTIGITLDDEGWADIDLLIAGSERLEKSITIEKIRKVVETCDKKRFSLSEDGLFIRAVQGHSAPSVNISYPITQPPEFLYHGTATRFTEMILAEGLKPQKRQYVHLSSNVDTAVAVGRRHGSPLVLRVYAGIMHESGIPFYRAENGVWLVHLVLPQYFTTLSTN